MFAALVSRDPALARQRMAEGKRRWAYQPANYPGLAESAVLLAEGRYAAAHRQFDDWMVLAAEPSHDPHLRVGNHWAIDILQQRFGSDDTPT